MGLVYLKNKTNGVTYVYESENYWDKQKKQSRSKRVCVGKLDDKGQFVPSKRIANQEALSAQVTLKETVCADARYHRSFYGATFLLDQIGEKLGLTDDLKRCFPHTWKSLLSVVYYLVLEDNASLMRFEKWGQLHKHPFGNDISSQRSSELFQSIGDEARNHFFSLQGKRRAENEFWAYDISSISSYSQLLNQVKYGKNKEDDRLPQFNLALVFGERSNLPFYYRKLAGNIPDVKTLKTLLADMGTLGFKRLKLVMDRGFWSEENINALYKEHSKFLVSASTSLSFIRKELDSVYGELDLYKHYNENHHIYAATIQSEWLYSQERPYKDDVLKEKRRIYVHLYFNGEKAASDRTALENRLAGLRHELVDGPRKPEHENLYKKFFDIKNTPVKGTQVTINDDAVIKARRYFGYFALVSNEKMDAIEALELYRNRDLVEKAFGNLKERLNMRRTLVSSEQSLDGKLFVEFVALIYLSYIKAQMQRQNLFKDYTMQGLLDKLDVIECFEAPNKALRVGEVLAKQTDIFVKLGVEPPRSGTSL